jgi:hypothetical protein
MSIKKLYLSDDKIRSLFKGETINKGMDNVISLWLKYDAIITTDETSREIAGLINEYMENYPHVTREDKNKIRIKLSKWGL